MPQNEIGHQGVRQLEQGKKKIIESISDIGLKCTWDIVTCVCVLGGRYQVSRQNTGNIKRE